MAFSKTLSATDAIQLNEALTDEMRTFVAVMDVRRLTRCGGHASDPELLSILHVEETESTLVTKIEIQFNDGSALDCSGQCGGDVTQRSEKLLVTINRETGQTRWTTTDGVITSED